MTDLPDLTQKQFNFVKGILEGKTASDAYRAAYDCEGSSDEAIWVNASRVRHDTKVSLWLSRARAEALTTATMTKEAYLQELQRLARKCETDNNLGAAVKATELQGKVMGHYVEKHEDVGERQAFANVFTEIETQNPQLAALLKASLGGENTEDEGEAKLTH